MGDTILVPIELPDPDPLSPVLIDDLSSLDVVVLGHYGLPEQTRRSDPLASSSATKRRRRSTRLQMRSPRREPPSERG